MRCRRFAGGTIGWHDPLTFPAPAVGLTSIFFAKKKTVGEPTAEFREETHTKNGELKYK